MTTTATETELRYPVGKFDFDAPINDADFPKLIAAIAEAPVALRSAVAGLTRDQLETRYRPGGWTVKQVVHHVPDSHLNATRDSSLRSLRTSRRSSRMTKPRGPSSPTRGKYPWKFRSTCWTRSTCAGWRSCAPWIPPTSIADCGIRNRAGY